MPQWIKRRIQSPYKKPMYVLKSRKDSVTSVYDLVGADYWFY